MTSLTLGLFIQQLDATEIRYLSGDVFRVLTAVEMGSKNHEVVPVQLIAQISGLRSGGVNKCISELAKRNLVARVQNIKCEHYTSGVTSFSRTTGLTYECILFQTMATV